MIQLQLRGPIGAVRHSDKDKGGTLVSVDPESDKDCSMNRTMTIRSHLQLYGIGLMDENVIFGKSPIFQALGQP
jgi:hypothetical protein